MPFFNPGQNTGNKYYWSEILNTKITFKVELLDDVI